jgi:hypothetical protein
MQRPGTDPDNVQMSDILCDFCHRAWTEDQPFVEGHRGSCICGQCLAMAYRQIAMNESSAAAEPPPGLSCALCLEAIVGPAWRSPAYPDAAVCRRCVKQAAGVLHKSPEFKWSKPAP